MGGFGVVVVGGDGGVEVDVEVDVLVACRKARLVRRALLAPVGVLGGHDALDRAHPVIQPPGLVGVADQSLRKGDQILAGSGDDALVGRLRGGVARRGAVRARGVRRDGEHRRGRERHRQQHRRAPPHPTAVALTHGGPPFSALRGVR